MKISLLLLLLTVLLSPSCVSQHFSSVSKKIENTCVKEKGKWTGQMFHDLWIKLYNDGKLDFLNKGFDTLYLLESYDVESGSYLGTIWNGKGTLNYSYNRGTFKVEPQHPFTAYTIQLIEKWDTVTLRNEERINAVKLPERNISGVRVIKQGTKMSIDCIGFKEFFRLDRDR